MRIHAHPGVVLVLMVGLLVSSVYVSCLDHAARADTATHHGHDGLAGANAGHGHAHAHSDRSATDGPSETSTDDPASELCHHPSHGAGSELLIVQTVCDRCADLSGHRLPRPSVVPLTVLSQEKDPLDPHLVGVDRPPILFG